MYILRNAHACMHVRSLYLHHSTHATAILAVIAMNWGLWVAGNKSLVM